MLSLQRRWLDLWDRIRGGSGSRMLYPLAVLFALYLLVSVLVGIYWSWAPAAFDVNAVTRDRAAAEQTEVVVGSHTTSTLITLVETLLDKPGGYISNDRFPPGVWLDNISNWEFGVLVQARDLSRAMRKTFSRSQSQSTEQVDLTQAEPRLHFDNDSWLLPSTESEYRDALGSLLTYHQKLSSATQEGTQFYARADNLRDWLGDVSTRLGSLSQRLSASVGQRRVNTDLAGATGADQATAVASEIEVQTPWLEIDDVFYEARGTAWALIHILTAIEADFQQSLERKNAVVSLRQIIRELEATQNTIWSPMILNGSEFGLLANHSLVMASYISRANAAIIDLRELLSQG
ncbi:MAG TPA: DUF2333 family protein [Marinobacterium sp.]|nr:DUF2333 family protein [Marinobacterium sp.]